LPFEDLGPFFEHEVGFREDGRRVGERVGALELLGCRVGGNDFIDLVGRGVGRLEDGGLGGRAVGKLVGPPANGQKRPGGGSKPP